MMMNALQKIGAGLCLLFILLAIKTWPAAAEEVQPSATPTLEPRLLTPEELLAIVNQGRRQIGHRPLVLDPILGAYLQGQAELEANSIPSNGESPQASVMAMGYGYPETSDTIFCTSNRAILMLNGSDAAIPSGFGDVGERAVNNVYYRHIGFGISKGAGDWDGYVFYLLLACYGADNRYTPGAAVPTGSSTAAPVSQVIIPVRTSAPLANGQLIHEVRSGQSLWSIAIAYHTHIEDILRLNRLPPGTDTVYLGEKLFIPTPSGGWITPQAAALPAITAAATPPAAAFKVPTAVPSADGAGRQEDKPADPTGEGGVVISSETFFVGALLAGCLVFAAVKVFKR